jgi:hypothetical protein
MLCTDDPNAHAVLAIELRDLHHEHANQRVKQQRQYGDREQGSTIAQLVVHLPPKNQVDVFPVHFIPCNLNGGAE